MTPRLNPLYLDLAITVAMAVCMSPLPIANFTSRSKWQESWIVRVSCVLSYYTSAMRQYINNEKLLTVNRLLLVWLLPPSTVNCTVDFIVLIFFHSREISLDLVKSDELLLWHLTKAVKLRHLQLLYLQWQC